MAKGGSSQEIVNEKIRPLFGLMSAGAKFFNCLGVKNQKEAESLWEQFFQNVSLSQYLGWGKGENLLLVLFWHFG